MPPKNPLIHIRIDEELKDKAASVLSEYGLTISDAVRVLLTVIVKEGGLPPFLLSSPEQYDAWFRERVREAMVDNRPRVPHAEAMQRVRDNLARASADSTSES